MGEKTPIVDEETEALFIEEPDLEPEEEDELFLDEELPLLDEELLPSMSLDDLAETGPESSQQSGSSPGDQQPDFPEQPQTPFPQGPFSQQPQDYPPQAYPPQPYPPQPYPPQPYPQMPPQSQQQQGSQLPGEGGEGFQGADEDLAQQQEMPHYPYPPQYPDASAEAESRGSPSGADDSQPVEEEEEELLVEDGGEEKPGETEELGELGEPEELGELGELEPEDLGEEDLSIPEAESQDSLTDDDVPPAEENINEDLFNEEPEDLFTEPSYSDVDEAAEEFPEFAEAESQGSPEPSAEAESRGSPPEPSDESPPKKQPAEDDFLKSLDDEPEKDHPGEQDEVLEELPQAEGQDSSDNKAAGDESQGSQDKKPLSKDAILGLMNYLKDISSSLPEKKKDVFMQSDARLSMEFVINTLKGKNGLLKGINKKIPQKISRPPVPQTAPVTGEKIADTLSYLGNLSGAAKDKNLFTTLRQKVQSIMSRIKAVMDKRQNKHG